VGADGWIKHRATAPGANYLEIAGADSESCAYEKQEEEKMTGDVSHLILSFTFDIFALPLSGKAPELSTANWVHATNRRCRIAEFRECFGCPACALA
jgi:hypothetical protein